MYWGDMDQDDDASNTHSSTEASYVTLLQMLPMDLIQTAQPIGVSAEGCSTQSQLDARPQVRVSSPEIAADIRPLPSYYNVSKTMGAKKKISQAGKQGEKKLNDISNLLQVKPMHMKPKDDGRHTTKRPHEKEVISNDNSPRTRTRMQNKENHCHPQQTAMDEVHSTEPGRHISFPPIEPARVPTGLDQWGSRPPDPQFKSGAAPALTTTNIDRSVSANSD